MKLSGAIIALVSMAVAACASVTPAPVAVVPSVVVPTPLATTAPAPLVSAAVPATRLSTPSMGNVPAQVPACPADLGAPLFNTMPLDLSDFIAWRPLGFLSPPIHVFPAKHSSFAMTLPGGTPPKKPVKAPGQVWVVEVWAATFSTGGANFQVYFYPCRDFRAYFYHLSSVSERLASQMRTITPRCNSFYDGTATVTTCRYEGMAIALDAGEQMGVGTDTSGVDFGSIDFRVAPAPFANIGHYSFDYPYYVSPVKYFTPEERSLFESKTGSVFGDKLRTVEPKAGNYMQDTLGTAAGNWFLPGINYRTNTDISSAIALVHDYVDPAQPILSVGTSVSRMKMGLYSFAVQSEGLVNRDFDAVRPDGRTYCYDSFLRGPSAGGMGLAQPPGILALTMPTDKALKVELLPAASCKTQTQLKLTDAAVTFER